MYDYDYEKAGRDLYVQWGVRDSPFLKHNLLDQRYSYTPIPDKSKKKKATNKKATPKKLTGKKSKEKKEKAWWEI